MVIAKQKSAEDWVAAACRVLAVSGVNGVKVERLAKDLGVTKGSFYWHFADRPALLDAVLETWVRMDTERVIELVEAEPDTADPAAALQRLVSLTMGPPAELDGIETGIREWSATDERVAKLCAEVDGRRLDYVTDLFIAAGLDPDLAAARAGLLYRVVIGEYSWRRYGGTPIEPAALVDLVELLSAP